MLGLKSILGTSLVLMAAGLIHPSVAAAEGDWAVTSVVEYRTVIPGPGHDTVEDRITITVPDGVNTVWWDTESGSGFAPVSDDRVVLTVHPSFGPGGDREPLTLTLSTSENSASSWTTTIDEVYLARATVLTVNLPKKRIVAAGTKVRVTGSLTANGAPITNHWVAVGDFRQYGACDASCGTNYIQLGSGQVDESGAWEATVPIPWTTRLSASYCMEPASCWDNPNAPAFELGSSINARWAPTLRPPANPRAGRMEAFKVTLPYAYAGVPIVLQARRGDTWSKIGNAKVRKSTTVEVRAQLPAGRSKVRAVVPQTARQLFPHQTDSWTLRRVLAGTSRPSMVTVSR